MAPLIVILAGGEGSRMGGDKPLRMLAGERLIDRALKRAMNWSDAVRVALRSEEQVPGLQVPVLRDDPALGGPLAGLASALEAARAEGRSMVLTLPCDMPFLPDDLPQRLGEALADYAAAVAASEGRLHPVCAMWRTEVLDAMPAYLATGRRSLKGMAEAVGFAAVEWPDGIFANVNTPAELVESERRLRLQGERGEARSGG